jgi:hypothetical protein
MLELINTGIMGGILVTGLYWMIRNIKKERRKRFDSNDTTVAS